MAAQPSLYAHVAGLVAREDVDGLRGDLPDAEAPSPDSIRFAPGALDGIRKRHFGAGRPTATLDELVDLIAGRQAERGPAHQRLYELTVAGDALASVDALVARLQQDEVPTSTILPTARWLAFEGLHRDAVKLGIALLGLGHEVEDRSGIHVLGRHSEFTLFAAVALVRTAPDDPDRELFALARHVDGWGRIELVERLAQTEDEEIRSWIFHEGFRNSIDWGYLAYIAATTGDLRGRLADPDPPADTIRAARDILGALLAGGPSEEITDYSEAGPVVLRLLEVLAERDLTLEHLDLVVDVRQHLERRDVDDDATGWTPDRRAAATSLVETILADERARSSAREGLAATDLLAFERAERVAHAVGIDTVPALVARVRLESTARTWFQLLRRARSRNAMSEAVALAEQLLPLDELATGPGTALGLGPGWEPEQALGYVAQELRFHPGLGWPILATALQSELVRNRSMAIAALDAWGHAAWPDDAVDAIHAAAAIEPDESIRARLEALLA